MESIKDVEARFKKLVCCPNRAEFTCTSGFWVVQIATSKGNEILHILPACLTRRRMQINELNRGAIDQLSTDGFEANSMEERSTIEEGSYLDPIDPRSSRCKAINGTYEGRNSQLNQTFRVKAGHLHPLPPAKLSEWLQNTIAVLTHGLTQAGLT